MSAFLFSFFHNKTNELTNEARPYVPKDMGEWPESWKKISYKKYILLKPTVLPESKSTPFLELLRKRYTSRLFGKRGVIDKASISYISLCAYGLQGGVSSLRAETRTVPSAGTRYPLEVYLFLFKEIDGLGSGIYHYSTQEHSLQKVASMHFDKEQISSFFAEEMDITSARGMFVITGVFGRSVIKYGDRGYRYILLEAGHVMQNLLLAAVDLDIGVAPIGGLHEDKIEKCIGLNGRYEGVLYAALF